MPAAKTTTKKTTPKAPQDRKPKAVEEEPLVPEEVEGWDLMKDFSDIPIWDQTPLISMLERAFRTEEDDVKTDAEIDAMTDEEFAAYDKARKANLVKSFDLNIIGDLARALVPYAKDEAEYTKFVSGTNAMERAMNLAIAWVGQMGESGSSVA